LKSDITIRQGKPGDLPGIRALYPAAFPDEDLLPFMTSLLEGDFGVTSLVAAANEVIVGHIAFTPCGIEGGDAVVWLLAPLAVLPAFQKQGIGSALISEGLAAAKQANARSVCVLGDPNYYGRSGFVEEKRIRPPYELPPEWGKAWQSLSVCGVEIPGGKLIVPEPWQDPALWA
jgi:putative acetyltransferase